jgi:hypothetical protein
MRNQSREKKKRNEGERRERKIDKKNPSYEGPRA